MIFCFVECFYKNLEGILHMEISWCLVIILAINHLRNIKTDVSFEWLLNSIPYTLFQIYIGTPQNRNYIYKQHSDMNHN